MIRVGQIYFRRMGWQVLIFTSIREKNIVAAGGVELTF